MRFYKRFRFNVPYQLLKLVENKQESNKFVNDLFWRFNIILGLILVLNEIFGFFFVPVFHLLIKGYSFTTFSAYSILLYLVPIFAFLIRKKLNEKPVLKLQFLFGIEIPILVLVIIRQEMLYNLNMSLKYLFLLFFVMILLYFIKFFFQRNETNGKFLFILKLRKLLLYFLNVFFSIIFIGSIVPLSLILLKNSLDPSFIRNVEPWGYLVINLLLISSMIVVLYPVWFALSYSTKAFKNMVYGMNLKHRITYLSSIIILFSTLYILNINNESFMCLNLKNETSLLKQKELFFNNKDQLEKEFHQLASQRKYYLGSLQNNTFSEIIKHDLKLNDKHTKLLQSSYNVFMYPFFYQDTEMSGYDMEYKAEELYEQFFDESINHSDYYGFNWGVVHIDKQEIDIIEYGDIAEIQVCETYSTHSDFSQEIMIHFELPYNSVVTGLWMTKIPTKNIQALLLPPELLKKYI